MLQLYRFPGATCPAKVLLALFEKNVPFQDEIIAYDDITTEWYRKLNPNSVVPTIVHNGATIIESPVILNYIEDAFDGPKLRPEEPLRRAQMNHWLKLADDALYSLGTMTYSIAGRHAYLSKSKEELEAFYLSTPDYRKQIGRRNAVELGLDSPEVPPAVTVLKDLQR